MNENDAMSLVYVLIVILFICIGGFYWKNGGILKFINDNRMKAFHMIIIWGMIIVGLFIFYHTFKDSLNLSTTKSRQRAEQSTPK